MTAARIPLHAAEPEWRCTPFIMTRKEWLILVNHASTIINRVSQPGFSSLHTNCTTIQNTRHDWRLSRGALPILISIQNPTAWGKGIKYAVCVCECVCLLYIYMKDMCGHTLLQHSTSNKSQRHRRADTMKGCNIVTLQPSMTKDNPMGYLIHILSHFLLPLFSRSCRLFAIRVSSSCLI